MKSLGTLSNLNKSNGYSISEQYDLSEFKNETIRLKLTTTTDPFETTAFLVDDIALMVVYDKIDILAYYRRLGSDPDRVETTDLIKAMDDSSSKTAPSGFARPITIPELSALINEWVMT